MTWSIVVWIYTALLVAGGVIGVTKAGSRISLVAAIASAIPLALAAAGVLPFIAAAIVLGALLVIFGLRFTKTRKFMPSGMLLVLTLITVVAILVLRPQA